MCFSAPDIPTSGTQKGQSPDMEMRARAEAMRKPTLEGAKEQEDPAGKFLAAGVAPPAPGTRGRPLQNKLGSDIPVSASRGLLTT